MLREVGFSFFQLLHFSAFNSSLQAYVLVSFSCYVGVHCNRDGNIVVLVSFSCYACLLVLWAQQVVLVSFSCYILPNLTWPTVVKCFSFFQLLLERRERGAPPDNGFSFFQLLR